LLGASGCHLGESGPSDQEVVDAVRKTPPSPPTAGPTYLAEIASVTVEDRGRYNTDGNHWPVRVRVRGGLKIKMTNVAQMSRAIGSDKQPWKAVDFLEEACLARDDFGNWHVWYNYDPAGPRWRLEEPSARRTTAK
jgi:hypothetical protein